MNGSMGICRVAGIPFLWCVIVDEDFVLLSIVVFTVEIIYQCCSLMEYTHSMLTSGLELSVVHVRTYLVHICTPLQIFSAVSFPMCA